MKKAGRYFLIYILLATLTGTLFGQNNPAVATCDGQQFICVDSSSEEVCVTIVLDPSYAFLNNIDYFLLSWGDFTMTDTILFADSLPNLYHVYLLDNFFNSCAHQLVFPVILETIHSDPDIDPTNSAFFFTIRNPPSGNFVILPPQPCTGDSVLFLGSTIEDSLDTDYPNCQAIGINFVEWDFGDGNTSSNILSTHVYDSSGLYTAQFCSGNVCDTLCNTTEVAITGMPKAIVLIDSSLVENNSDTFSFCLNNGNLTLLLDAQQSVFADSFFWELSGDGDFEWLPGGELAPDSSLAALHISGEGTYQLQLIVNNFCNQPDNLTIWLKVLPEPSFYINPQADTCFPLAFQPSPLFDNATYSINGDTVTQFPTYLDIADTPYFMAASLSDFCGLYVLADTFAIKALSPPVINSPADETAFCINELIPLVADSTEILWIGEDSIIGSSADTLLFSPFKSGEFLLIAEKEFGQCKSRDSVSIHIEEPIDISLDYPEIACLQLDYSPEPFDDRLTYAINGLIRDSFPVSLDTSQSPFIVQAFYENSCKVDTAAINFSILSKPIVDIIHPADSLFCADSLLLPLQASLSGGFWYGNPLVIVDSLPYLNTANSGQYSIYYETGKGSCLAIDSIKIIVLPVDTVDAGPDAGFCFDEESYVFLPTTPTGGFFSGNGSVGNVVDVQELIPDSNYYYTYTVPSFPEGCRSDSLILVRSSPVFASLLQTQDSFCLGDTVFLSTGLKNNINWLIKWGDGQADSTVFYHVYDSSGTFNIHLSTYVKNPSANFSFCFVDTSLTVFIGEPPAAGILSFELSDSIACPPVSINFLNQSQLPEGEFFWDFGNGETFIGESPPPISYTANSLGDTTYIIRLSSPGKCGLSKSSRSLRVVSPPKAAFGIESLNPCSGEEIEATLLSVGDPDFHYFFTSTGQVYSVGSNSNIFLAFSALNQPDTLSLNLVASNYCGNDTASKELIIFPENVQAAFEIGPLPHCVGQTISLFNQSTAGTNLTWKFKDGQLFNGDTLQISFQEPGVYPVSLTAEGCDIDSTFSILNINPLPIVQLQTPLFACPDSPVPFTVNTNAALHTLNYGDGDLSYEDYSTHFFSLPGIYQPEVIATSDAGCINSTIGQIQIHPKPEAEINIEGHFCQNNKLTFTALPLNSNAACNWEFGNSVFSGKCQTSLQYPDAGNFRVLLKRTNLEGCVGRDTANITIEAGPEASPEWIISDPCAPMTVHFENANTNIAAHYWSLGDGSIRSESAFSYLYEDDGTFSVLYIATAANQCTDTFRAEIKVLPKVPFNVGLESYCSNLEGIDLLIETLPENIVFLDVNGIKQQGLSFPALPAGYAYPLTILSPDGCKVDTSIMLLEKEELRLKATPDSAFLLLGEDLQLSALTNMDGISFVWYPPDWLDNPFIAKPLARPLSTVLYTVEAIDTSGCRVMDSVFVRVAADRENSLFFPDAFTPNKDGVNDVFYPRLVRQSIKSLVDFRVVDKFNEVVFDLQQLPDFENALPDFEQWGWDGTFKGEKAEAGAYRYLVKVEFIDGQEGVFSGTILLIR